MEVLLHNWFDRHFFIEAKHHLTLMEFPWGVEVIETLSVSTDTHIHHQPCCTFCLVFFLQVLWHIASIQGRVNTSTVAWGATASPTTRTAKENASVWTSVNHTINLYAAQMGSCTRITASSTGPPASLDTRSPLCTMRSASTKVSTSLTFC